MAISTSVVVALDLLIDRGDVRRRRDLGVGEIEGEQRVERERQLLVVEHRGGADAVGHLEHEAHEGRLHQRAHADRRPLLGAAPRRAAARSARSAARARSASSRTTSIGRRGGGPLQPSGSKSTKVRSPAFMVLMVHPPRQRQPDRAAVGIAARGGDVVGRAFGKTVDGNVDRSIEADHDDGAGGRDLGGDVLGELEHQPGIAAGWRKTRLALDRIGRRGQVRAEANDQAAAEPSSTGALRTRQRQPARARARARDKNPAAASRAIADMSSGSTIRIAGSGAPSPVTAQDSRFRQLTSC